MRHIIPISGKDSLATALLQTAYRPNLDYEFVFNDTGCELPETYDWLNQVEQKTSWTIHRVGKPLEEIINRYNGFLPGQRSRYCTREAKIQPLEEWLSGGEACVYYGLRADEQRTGYVPVAGSSIIPVYPLRPRSEGGVTPNGVDIQGVFSILGAQGLIPPDFFWQRAYNAVAARLKCVDWEPALKPWQFRVLFSGRSRGNCYLCFFQQQVEFLWLLETHPDLFWRAAEFEKTAEQQPDKKRKTKLSKYSQMTLIEMNDATTSKQYTWQKGFCLNELADSKVLQDKIFDRHIKSLIDQILKILNHQSFGIIADNEIAFTSCGLLCGK